MSNLDLNVCNFFSDLIFHPEHAKPEEQNKCLALSIFLGVVSLGTIPLVVGAFWVGRSVADWITSQLSPTDAKTNEVVQKTLPPAIPKGYEAITNPDLMEKLSQLKLDDGVKYEVRVPEKPKPEEEDTRHEYLKRLYPNKGGLVQDFKIYCDGSKFYLNDDAPAIDAILDLDWTQVVTLKLS